jgi:hypothetical protein
MASEPASNLLMIPGKLAGGAHPGHRPGHVRGTMGPLTEFRAEIYLMSSGGKPSRSKTLRSLTFI